MPILPRTTRRPYEPAPAPKKPYAQHAARTSDYDSARWKALRKQVRAQQPVCATPGCGKAAAAVDHTVPVRLGGSMWDRDNLVAYCWSCHQRKSQAERGARPQ